MLEQLKGVVARNQLFVPRHARYQSQPSADTLELQNLKSPQSLPSPSIASPSKSDVDISYDPHYEPSVISSHLDDAPRQGRFSRYVGPRFSGWRFGVLNFAVWAIIVFLINFIVTIWGSVHLDGGGIIFEGDCKESKTLNSGLHILINIFSTVLLSGSNYCMQCLSAPTRKEVDAAHARGTNRYLDIGVPGVRNLLHISKRRAFLWIAISASSVPLHLLYNSAVFGSIASYDYWALSVSENFVTDPVCRGCDNDPNQTTLYRYTEVGPNSMQIAPLPYVLHDMQKKALSGGLERLSADECISQYAQIIQSNHRNVLLVAADKNFPGSDNNPFIPGSDVYWTEKFESIDARSAQNAAGAYDWICGALLGFTPCTRRLDQVKGANWRVGRVYDPKKVPTWPNYHSAEYTSLDYPVEYCLAEKAMPRCKIQFEPTIAYVVTSLNFFKVVLMLYIAFWINEEPLITMGDAVKSFLTENDPTTKDMCLASMRDIIKATYQAGPRQWNDERLRWKDVTSKIRRFIVLAMFVSTLSVVCFLLWLGMTELPTGTQITRLGYGTVDPRTTVSGLPNTSTIAVVLLANIPQLILSILYFNYNALFTGMLLGYEWVSYFVKRKGLRVSAGPRGFQRSTYFLQLPYRFGIPMMILSGTLHWLVSQSIFLVSIDFWEAYDDNFAGGHTAMDGMRTLGYSPVAIISVIVLGCAMIASIVGFGFIPYQRGMPLAGSNSMAISAACHAKGEERSALKEVQWGVVSTTFDGVGHCSFSAKSVSAPVKGEVYS